MVTLVITVTAWISHTSQPMMWGLATYYDYGLMEKVASNRHMSLSGYIGGVALNRAGDIGREVWVIFGQCDVVGPFLVVDCARKRDYMARERAGYIVEVPAEIAVRYGFYRRGPVQAGVSFIRPACTRFIMN